MPPRVASKQNAVDMYLKAEILKAEIIRIREKILNLESEYGALSRSQKVHPLVGKIIKMEEEKARTRERAVFREYEKVHVRRFGVKPNFKTLD
jgi:hypothetical protein